MPKPQKSGGEEALTGGGEWWLQQAKKIIVKHGTGELTISNGQS
jgi:hypothetical protein